MVAKKTLLITNNHRAYTGGVIVYDEFDQISQPNDTPENLRSRACIYKYDNTEQQILKAINE